MTETVRHLEIRADASIREAMAAIDRGAKGIVVVVDDERTPLGTITDGDIRRALLKGWNLSTAVCEILSERILRGGPKPTTAPVSTHPNELIRLMRSRSVRHVVLLDSHGRFSELATLDELIPYHAESVEAVVMAGGRGRRLIPLTDELPKPMLPIGGRPMLEWILDGLKRAGVCRVTIASHYKAEAIRRHFGNGWRFGLQIRHLYEDRATGTAGPLRRVPAWEGPLLVVNGDVFTWVDFGAMVQFHREHAADLTVAVRKHDFQVPYGVVDLQGLYIRGIEEKPTLPCFVNAGIYVLQPSVQQHLWGDDVLDMTELIDRALAGGLRIVGFPVTEYWADIGRLDDYERARDHADALGELQGAAG
jgi:dTDP-glucose pyrophosphorylase/CBS domain-containing protein